MTPDNDKKEIIREVIRTGDESVLNAISKLLKLPVHDISEENNHILSDRVAEYETNPDNVIDWEALKAELQKE